MLILRRANGSECEHVGKEGESQTISSTELAVILKGGSVRKPERNQKGYKSDREGRILTLPADKHFGQIIERRNFIILLITIRLVYPLEV